ncbi:MAG: hypothetical protein V3V53_01120 [Bacteroidales bacterium]
MIGDEWKNGKLELTNNIFQNLADAGVSVANPVPSKDVSGPDYTDAPWWFKRVDFKGAFRPGTQWAGGWTLTFGSENLETGIYFYQLRNESGNKLSGRFMVQ